MDKTTIAALDIPDISCESKAEANNTKRQAKRLQNAFEHIAEYLKSDGQYLSLRSFYQRARAKKSRPGRVHFSFPIKNQDFYILHLSGTSQTRTKIHH